MKIAPPGAEDALSRKHDSSVVMKFGETTLKS